MASRYPEFDIFPKEGMDLRDPAGLEWFANVWRPERSHQIRVRRGFGQLTQQDCTSEKANVDAAISSQAEGGYQRHLGSYLYNSNFGHRQIISVFEAVVQYSGSDAPAPLPSSDHAMQTIHGVAKTAVVSIYDLTTGVQWEEVLILHTSENCQEIGIPQAHGHFETTTAANASIATSFINFKYHNGVENASFAQIGDSCVLCLGEYGVWVYHGVDVAKTKQRVLDSTDVAPNRFTGSAFTVGTNYQTKSSEGSVLQPVSGVRGLNGEQFTYFTKSEFPSADVATVCKGRMVYALRGVLYFSDVGQPGAIMADNFAEIQTEGRITGIGEHNGQLFAFSKTEAHLIQMKQSNLAGAAFANQVSVTHVRISKRTGCVGPRSVVETPFGVCWVSDQGCHIAGAQQAVEDLSDAIRDYWDAGIIDPTTHYYPNNGAGGTKTQPDVIYKHLGEPTLSYEPQTETLFVAYDDHVLVYQFRHKSWSIWPLGTTKPNGPLPQKRQTINCLDILSDSLGTYIIGGLHDQTEDGLSPAVQSSSYYITQLERGGSMDRSCKDEDSRRHGWGRYTYSVDPAAAVVSDDHCYYLEKPQRIWTSDDGTKIVYEFPVYFETFRPALWPPALAPGLDSFTFNLSWNAAFTFEGLGLFPEAGLRSQWTFSNTASSVNTLASAMIGLANVTQYRMPIYVLRLSAPVGTTARTDFVVSKATATNQAGNAELGVRVLLWQQQHLYAAADRSTNNRLESNVEWGIKTGQIGLNEGKVLRVRGINAIMESSTSQSSELYNSYTVSDYKRLSGQYPDYGDYTPGNRRQTQTNLIRERMLYGRRVFNSLAKWAPTTAVNTKYLIDSPELNSIVTSVSARGEHVSVGLYGYATDKADELTIHRLSLGILETGNRRRKGR